MPKKRRKNASQRQARALEFLLEERSCEHALKILLPRMLQPVPLLSYRVFQGKGDLLENLPQVLRGYKQQIISGRNLRVVVLLDQDQQDCVELKHKLMQHTREAQLIPFNHARADQPFHVLNRIAVEELEAWFFGDIEALCAAYPNVRSHLGDLARRDPDSIPRGTAEALERLLKKAGYYKNGMPKIEVAQRIAHHIQPDRNRSRSFRVFREGLSACLI
jgi:hypothetical protein